MKAPLRTTLVAWMALAAVAAAVVVTGCGSSSKPEYCSNVSELEGSVEELKGGIHLESGALPTLEADLTKVQSNADAGRDLGEGRFPERDQRVESSVSSLSDTINKLPRPRRPRNWHRSR